AAASSAPDRDPVPFAGSRSNSRADTPADRSANRRPESSRVGNSTDRPRDGTAPVSVTYRTVGWNPQKRRYDLVAATTILACLGVFAAAEAIIRPELTVETLLIRSLGATAFVVLNVILCIGPLARLDRRFLPLLYNRRHLGVMM